MDKQIYQLFILIYFDMFRMYLFFYYFHVNNCRSFFFSMLFFFNNEKSALVHFFSFLFYNISGNLEWCVCMCVYSSLLRSFPLWPCCVGGFLLFFFFLIYIYIFFSLYTSLCTLIDSLDRPIVQFLLLFFSV